jgi:hypothetical protein
MIQPVHFGYNAETAVNNAFQTDEQRFDTQEKALQEFSDFVEKLRAHKIDVTVLEDTAVPYTPDSIFPNNWISFHGKTICLYPMFAVNRREERKQHVTDALQEQFGFTNIVDLTYFESENVFLEGTGSMVLDRENKIAYACLSPRTDNYVLDVFAEKFGYTPVKFTATDAKGQQIYHTNVMMCIADKYAVICLETIADNEERETMEELLLKTGKQIIAISQEQLNHFAGNMLQVENADGEKFLVMSTQAYESLHPAQVEAITRYNQVIHSDLTTIETNGGGSARCMMAEIFV